MAEILATMVVGPLVSMVKEKASSYLLEQYKVMEGMEEQHKVLKRKLPAILDVIADAEMQAAEHREGAKAWLEEVRMVAYQANDVFDEFKYEALRRKAKKEGQYRKLGMHVIKLFPTHNRIVFRYKMGNKLQLILQAIEVLITEMNVFRFRFKPGQQLSMKGRQTDSQIVDPMEIASRSRATDKEKVVRILLAQGSSANLTVLPIVGMGGLGKTTLAQLVYNDSKIQEHFQLLLWVCVSDNFDVDLLAKSIVEAAPREKKNGSETVRNSPLDSLKEMVSGMRYLLVLDDVWNRDASLWEKLKSYLQHGNMGSCVLTTTRDEAIAKFMGTTKAYKLQILSENFIEEIIMEKAFSSKQGPAELEKMVGDMVKRCAGSPLAAAALGSVLRTKSRVEEWKAVLSRSTICDDETGILPILKLSYNDLPSQMRQCFSFCAMFPKDYEIDVEMLIQLWMANGFILEEKGGVCPEIRGKQIFTELASRSFFQDVKEIPFSIVKSIYGYSSGTTCKIHDLMHDVAQSVMGKECAVIAEKPSEDFPYSTRHLFVQFHDPKSILNGFLENRSPTLQTVLCTKNVYGQLQYFSKYNSIRALRIKGDSTLKPKYMHHLRYLDLSGTDISALPEDISILYHLQTLNLSNCRHLSRLPNGMKYMSTLRHLYTHGCSSLETMPPELRCLASLQTLTYFPAGDTTTDSSCSTLGELEMLDLGGELEICQLENVAEQDAKVANLGDKKRLTTLRFIWTPHSRREPRNDDKVLEGLKPHDGIKVLSIYSYGGSTYPTWMNSYLQQMVELVLHDCNKLEKLPPLWQLPALRILYMWRLENLHCFCSGDHPFTFKKLKELYLFGMSNFKTWWDINEMQGQDNPPVVFPELEKLSIESCGKLTALPRASSSVISGSSGGVINTTTAWRSACPSLRELKLLDLAAFQRWEEAGEVSTGEQLLTFPCLEKLLIKNCPELTTLPPKAPKLSELKAERVSQQIWHVAKYITSLSILELSLDGGETTLLPPNHHSLIELVDDREKWSHESSALRVAILRRCDVLFSPSSAPVLWKCFVQLEDLQITECHTLVHWPENVFRCLVSLRKLMIGWCGNLTGLTQQDASSDQSTSSTPGRSVVFPPRLESLELIGCGSLVEVPTLPASLRKLYISRCKKLESVLVRKQHSSSFTGQEMITGSSCNEATSGLSPPVSLEIDFCDNLLSLSVQQDCTELSIIGCPRLKSLDGDLPSLERFILDHCFSLESIPDGPQAYSSLTYLKIRECTGLKVLPQCLKERLNDIAEKDLDARYTEPEPEVSRPSIWRCAIGRLC